MLIFSRFRQLGDKSAQETIRRKIMGHMLQCVYLHQWLRSMMDDRSERLAPRRVRFAGISWNRSSSSSLCYPSLSVVIRCHTLLSFAQHSWTPSLAATLWQGRVGLSVWHIGACPATFSRKEGNFEDEDIASPEAAIRRN